jgi:hypothetical protein
LDNVTFDIETMIGDKLHPWQASLVAGFKKGEMRVMSAGRQTGKSMFTAQAIERLMRDLNSQPVSDMVLNEGKVYGSRYYTVEPVGGNWLEMEQWCSQVFGDTGTIWGESKVPEPACRWYANNRKFWFRTEKDRDWFIIKWRA